MGAACEWRLSAEHLRPDPAPPVPVVEFSSPVQLQEAMADPVRYRALKELAPGAYLSPTEPAKRLG